VNAYLSLVNSCSFFKNTHKALISAKSFYVNRFPWQPHIQQFSRHDVGRSYQVLVDLPPRYEQAGDRDHHLFLCLDGQWTFGSTVDTVRLLAPAREVPEAIVVGIVHDEPVYRELVQQRAMDYTTTQVDAPLMTGVRVPGSELGGASLFAEWIQSVVLPTLKSQYRVSELTLIGHSFSALCGVQILLNTPKMFDHYLLASPSVWWDDQVMFRKEEEYFENNSALDAQVFMSKGSLETDEYSPHREFYDQVKSRNYEDLVLHWKEFEGESHLSVVQTAINCGLRVLHSKK
jgi:predicted alpha/beta superfamily hydrolase